MRSNFFRGVQAGFWALALMGWAQAYSAEFRAGSLVVKSPWTRATPRGATVGGGYLIVRNFGATSDQLLGGTFSSSDRLEIHTMTIEGGVARMREATTGITIGPGETFNLEPAGAHLMFVGLMRPLVAGDKVKGILKFEHAGQVDVEFEVVSMGAKGPQDQH